MPIYILSLHWSEQYSTDICANVAASHLGVFLASFNLCNSNAFRHTLAGVWVHSCTRRNTYIQFEVVVFSPRLLAIAMFFYFLYSVDFSSSSADLEKSAFSTMRFFILYRLHQCEYFSLLLLLLSLLKFTAIRSLYKHTHFLFLCALRTQTMPQTTDTRETCGLCKMYAPL